MTKYLCPICNKRACDSNKILNLTRLSETNEYNADVVIKCKNCKTALAITVDEDSLFVNRPVLPNNLSI